MAYLNSNTGRLFSLRGKRGAIQEGLNLSDLKEIEVFVPSNKLQSLIESIIKKYDLKDKALLRLAEIVHAADVAQDIDKDPIGRGLDAIAVGSGLLHPDDEENLGFQFEVYDALYAWCRLQVAKG